MQSRAEGFFLKSRPLGKKESRSDKVARSKRRKIGSFIRWFICQLSPGSVNLLAAASRFLVQFSSEIVESSRLPSQRQYTVSAQHCSTKFPRGHIVFTGQTTQLGAPWRSLSLCRARGVLVTSNIAIPNIGT